MKYYTITIQLSKEGDISNKLHIQYKTAPVCVYILLVMLIKESVITEQVSPEYFVHLVATGRVTQRSDTEGHKKISS